MQIVISIVRKARSFFHRPMRNSILRILLNMFYHCEIQYIKSYLSENSFLCQKRYGKTLNESEIIIFLKPEIKIHEKGGI